MDFYTNLSKYIKNNLFTSYTLDVDFKNLYKFEENLKNYEEILNQITQIYDSNKFINQNEHQFEDGFISKVLEILGWSVIRQDEKIIQGKLEKPDFLLFSNKSLKSSYEKLNKEDRKNSYSFDVVLESKAYEVELDNKKVQNNPHFQILRYLSNFKKDYGFLTNGRFWRFYDNKILTSNKVFFEINLELIIKDQNYQALAYFVSLFGANNYKNSEVDKIITQNNISKSKIEDDLRSFIYGTEGKKSLFEFIGAKIYDKNRDKDLKDVYENSLYFLFRLLFIVYFEDKFEELLSMHKYFKEKLSIKTLFTRLNQNDDTSSLGIGELEEIFNIYNVGKGNYDMPVFNGGLFDNKLTPLLNTPKIFSDKDLCYILDKILFFYDDKKYLRDYKTLSVEHLGTIYEGLLTYFFAIADEDLYYICYAEKKNEEIEGYFDEYDYKELSKKGKLESYEFYKKGDIYLKNSSNSRKNSASFYTPESIAEFLINSSIDEQISNIMKFKILDNACGSGHFLVGTLNYLTKKIVANFDDYPNLKKEHQKEKQILEDNLKKFVTSFKIDENDVLKRILLKRVIYGVDLNPFSIELTKLSLWIDSFIFGAPLSFIEHHIKCGNALISTQIKDFFELIKESSQNLFTAKLKDNFNDLKDIFYKLDNLKDTTEEDIKESIRIYRTQITPKLNELNLYLNYINALHFATGDDLKELEILKSKGIENLNTNEAAKGIIKRLNDEFKFFNYEVEFPESTNEALEFEGFDIIIGNPPWDRSSFDIDGYFSSYRSNYRKMKVDKQNELRINLLSKDYILKDYNYQKNKIDMLNLYYKKFYPLNHGSGDNNLFRLFVERNLNLLSNNGTLSYVLPSALMFEEGSYALREFILNNYTLNYFYAMENNDGLFRDVHRNYKFALMQIKKIKPKAKHLIKTMFYKTHPDQIIKKEIIKQSLNDIKLLSPNQLALMEIRSSKDIKILKHCYKLFKPLNLNYIDFRVESYPIKDKVKYFKNNKMLNDDFMFFEGGMIHQFNSNFTNPKYFIDKSYKKDRLINKELYRMRQDTNLKDESAIKFDFGFFRIVFRKIARDTDSRTLIASLIPKNISIVSDSLLANIPKRYVLDEKNKIEIKKFSNTRLLFILALFNSVVIDYLIRTMVQINVNKTYITRIPIPQPSDDEINNNEIYKEIYINALKLQLYNDKFNYFDDLKMEFGISDNEIPKTTKQYNILRAKNDLLIKEIYKINDEEFNYILSTFKVLNKNEPEYISLLKS